MAVYRFRVSFEDYDDVVRDIEIKSIQTFEDLHYAIQGYIGFDLSKPASFYMSDDYWKKGKEFTSRDVKKEEKEFVTKMSKARLCDFIIDPHQKIYYVFDFGAQWTFHIELIKIVVAEEKNASYPRCIKSVGDSPKQYGNVVAGKIPQPEDFDESEAEPLDDEAAYSETEEGIEADEVPVAIDSDEPIIGDLETADEEITDEEEPKDNEEF
jgi:hypothetical protein